jgi:hypothetical protein
MPILGITSIEVAREMALEPVDVAGLVGRCTICVRPLKSVKLARYFDELR